MSRLASLPVSLLASSIPEDTIPSQVATKFSGIFDDLNKADFDDNAVWRDSYALTGTLRTFYGAEQILRAWSETCRLQSPTYFRVSPDHSRSVQLPGGIAWIDVTYSFETVSQPQLMCTAILSFRFRPEDGRWKVWVMRTVADDLKDQPSLDIPPCKRSTTDDPLTVKQYDCLIIGAGQAGLSVAARCQALGVSYIVIDKNDTIGDNWRSRYDSARLHTLREYTHLPYDRTWTDTSVEYLSKDDLADGYIKWAEKFGINCCMSTTLERGDYDASRRLWSLSLRRNGISYTIKSAFVIMATGAGGQVPLKPNVPGEVRYTNRRLYQR